MEGEESKVHLASVVEASHGLAEPSDCPLES